ncbi:protein flowering locus t [Phtheirospermum japonicum]|uniref:Protein flowering locus t n=1 Tax=Phtheirospermum japonicum TaxID=374723 RepID=A0A830B8U7_9LAMI|nr:protein flowering locus t [Phtheirospermum japonicum]
MTIERHPLVVSRVVGDVLEPFTATAELRVFSDGRIIYNGSSLRPSQVAGRPRVEIGDSGDFRTFYTLVMVDADAPNPSNPHFKEYLHWLVTDIPGSTGVGFGKEVVSYESPQPSMGIHRLVLALFRQAARQTVNAPIRRQNFNTREFSQLHNLGSPVAAVYYNCHRENGTGGRRA